MHFRKQTEVQGQQLIILCGFWPLIGLFTVGKGESTDKPEAEHNSIYTNVHQISMSYYAWNWSKSLCAVGGVGGGVVV